MTKYTILQACKESSCDPGTFYRYMHKTKILKKDEDYGGGKGHQWISQSGIDKIIAYRSRQNKTHHINISLTDDEYDDLVKYSGIEYTRDSELVRKTLMAFVSILKHYKHISY